MARPNGNAAAKIAATKVKHEIVTTLATNDLVAESKALAKRGKDKPITEDDLDYALERLRAGDNMTVITDHLKLSAGAIWHVAYRDPEFHRRLSAALEIGQHTMVSRLERIASGELSTGSIERDKLLCDVILKVAKAYNRRTFGDKVEVEQRSVVINIGDKESEW